MHDAVLIQMINFVMASYLQAFIIFYTPVWWKEGNVLFNDALNTFDYIYSYMDQTYCKGLQLMRGNQLPTLHGLLFPISIKGSFTCTILDGIAHTTAFGTPNNYKITV